MPTWTEIQDFPEGIGITEVSISIENAVGIRESGLNYHQEVQVFPGQRMRMRVSFKPMTPETGSKLEAFFLKLRGRAGTFRFFDPYHSKPMGQACGLPVVVSAQVGEQTLQTSGWEKAVPFQLRAGDYLQLGENLHRVLEDVNSNVQGEAELTVWPNLRETYAAGTSLRLHNPTGLWRLSRDPSYQRTAVGQRHLTSMECVEAL